ncbi:MAG: hypothetical protein J2P28_24605 [Actinobacteria bacterium]|nr:hypothetical protein [Actinomycetota bacterium]
MDALDEWLTKVREELEVPADALDTDLLLGLAGEAAHAVVRPAAPLTTFLVGFAVGRGMPLPQASERVSALASSWPAPHPDSP